jgi:hypothetical protein
MAFLEWYRAFQWRKNTTYLHEFGFCHLQFLLDCVTCERTIGLAWIKKNGDVCQRYTAGQGFESSVVLGH